MAGRAGEDLRPRVGGEAGQEPHARPEKGRVGRRPLSLPRSGGAPRARQRARGGLVQSLLSGGPILYNTGDESTTDARDPNDFDGRRKDFNDENWKKWPKLKDALAAKATWRVWGCSATTHIKDMMRIALAQKKKKIKPDKLFLVETSVHYHGGGGVARSEDEMITLDSLRAFVDEQFQETGYCAAAARRLGIRC